MTKIQNTKRVSNFEFRISHPGVTLLFVVVVVAAFLSISLGIFTVIYGELRLAGEMSDSFRALYATDEAMEWLLYNDRNANGGIGVIPGCEGSGNCDYSGNLTTSAQNTCALVTLTRRGRTTTITATGEYPCNGGEFSVRRALLAVYQK